MMLAGIESLKQQGVTKFSLVYPGKNSDWKHLGHFEQVLAISWPQDGIRRYTASLYRFLQLAGQYSHIYCVGADVMDGFYSELVTLNLLDIVNMAQLSGAQTRIIGFSFNDKPRASAVAGLGQLPPTVDLLCRDVVSKNRLEQQISRPVELVADAAFLLVPTTDSPLVIAARQWIAQAKAEEQPTLVGLNICSTLVNLEAGLSAEDFAERYAQAFVRVAEQYPQMRLLLIPHDTRGDVSDVSLLQQFYQNLPATLQERTYSISGEVTAPEAKALCAGLDLVVAGRMHLAIAALGQATPVLGITYQGKFSGLFQHFELEQMTLSPQRSAEVSVFSDKILEQLARRNAIREQLDEVLPDVRALAQRNFQVNR